MNYDVIIVGAGPGGIFSAYELTRLRPELKVAVFEAGHPLKNRKCPIDGVRVKSCRQILGSTNRTFSQQLQNWSGSFYATRNY